MVPRGTIGPGPGIYRAYIEPEDEPHAIMPAVWADYCEHLERRDVALADFDASPLQVSKGQPYKTHTWWPDPRTCAQGRMRRIEPWEPLHVMVLLGRWRPPYRTRSWLQDPANWQVLHRWAQVSLPVFLAQSLVRNRRFGQSASVSAKVVRQFYRFLQRSGELNIGILQKFYMLRYVLKSRMEVRGLHSLTQMSLINRLRHDTAAAQKLAACTGGLLLSPAGSLYVAQTTQRTVVSIASLRAHGLRICRPFNNKKWSDALQEFCIMFPTGRLLTQQQSLDFLLAALALRPSCPVQELGSFYDQLLKRVARMSPSVFEHDAGDKVWGWVKKEFGGTKLFAPLYTLRRTQQWCLRVMARIFNDGPDTNRG